MKKTAAALSIAALLTLNACGSPGAEAEELEPASSSGSVPSDEELTELAADTVFDMEVVDLLGVDPDAMRPVADQLCEDVSTMSAAEFPIYAMAFIESAAADTPGVTESQIAQFMGISIGTYCPESAYLIP